MKKHNQNLVEQVVINKEIKKLDIVFDLEKAYSTAFSILRDLKALL
jgi:hypothetical protein